MHKDRALRFLDTAIMVARSAENGSRYFYGGVLVKNGVILNIGINRPHKTHPLSTARFRSIHCELDTILGVDREDVEGATLFIARVGFNGRSHIMNSFPCEHCQTLIKRMRLREVWSTLECGYKVWNVRNNSMEMYVL